MNPKKTYGNNTGSACTMISLLVWLSLLLDDASASVSSGLLLKLSRRNRDSDNGTAMTESRNRCFNMDIR